MNMCQIMKGKTTVLVCIILSTISVFGTCYMYRGYLFNYGYMSKQYSTEQLGHFNVKVTNLSSKSLEPFDNKTENNCKDCVRNVPNVIIQYGPPRTASTLQFQILCLMMTMLHDNNINSVGCYYDRKPPLKFCVIKTHNIDFAWKSSPKNAWIFMTFGVSQSQLYEKHKEKFEQQRKTIRLIVDTEMVSKRGHFIAYDYQSIFGLSDTQMSHIVTYLRYWDILRRCCGKQMSTDWRNHLSPIPNYKQHSDPNNTSYPACEMYNISEVEKLFINTYIYKRFTPVTSLRDTIGKPSTVDGNLTGHYCERCNRNIAKRGLHRLNDNCS